MTKSKQLSQWLWKWHIIAGLICMPFMAVLCISGSIYLFKNQFNDYAYQNERFVSVPSNLVRYSYSEQLNVAQAHSDGHIVSVTLPGEPNRATAFRQQGEGRGQNLIYVDPYTNQINGEFNQEKSFMQTVRKLHGELLIGRGGELLIELISSWVIVLALTGVYVWWPYKNFSVAGFLSVRTKKSRKVFWRDMHSVVGFWASAFLLIILAGGMPWTQLFGDNLKWVQTQTDTGYPKHWRNAKGLASNFELARQTKANSIDLDQVIKLAEQQTLLGEITIKLPKNDKGVYSISNTSKWLEDQKVIHVDQYSGGIIKALDWKQVGILMDLRQVFMRLHQGEYGVLNLVITLLAALSLFVSTSAAMISYLIRKPKGHWGLPKVPESFNAGAGILAIMVLLGIIFPAFGGSVLLIVMAGYLLNLLAAPKESIN